MMGISAQVSLYPIRRAHTSPVIEHALRVFRAHGLVIWPGDMSTLVTGDVDAVFAGLKESFAQAAEQGDIVMVVTLSNACPVTEASISQSL